MELKEFIKKALTEIIEAVDEVGQFACREPYLHDADGSRSIEFDIAVSASEKGTSNGGAGIRVLHFVEIGGKVGNEVTNTTVSRIKFGVQVSSIKKDEPQPYQSSPRINPAD